MEEEIKGLDKPLSGGRSFYNRFYLVGKTHFKMAFLSEIILGAITSKVIDAIENIAIPQLKESLQKSTEAGFWERLFEKITNGLATGFEEYSASEGEKIWSVNPDFFRDETVIRIFTSPDVFSLENMLSLEERFVRLYGKENIDNFRHNMVIAREIYERELNLALSPELRYQFSSLQKQLNELVDSQNIVLETVRQVPRLTVEALKQEQMVFISDDAAVNEKLNKEVGNEIEEAKVFIKDIEPYKALERLEKLKERVWDQVSDETRFEILIQMGRSYHLKDDAKIAADYFLRAIPFGSGSIRALKFASLAHLLRDEKTEAISLASQAIQKDPDDVLPYTYLAYANYPQMNYGEILQLIPEYHRGDPKIAFTMGQLAHLHKHPSAESWLRLAAENETHNPFPVLEKLATFLLEKILTSGQVIFPVESSPDLEASTSEVINLYDAAFDLIKNSNINHQLYRLLSNRGTAKLIVGHVDEAIIDLDVAIKNLAESAGLAKKSRAMAAMQKEDFEYAFQLLSEIEDDPNVPDARIWLAIVCLRQQRWNDVVSVTDRYLKENPGTSEDYLAVLRFNIAAKRGLKEFASAKKGITEFLKIKPDSPSGYALAATISNFENNQNEANDQISTAFKFAQKESDILELNWVVASGIELKKYDGVVNVIEKILQIRKDKLVLVTYIRMLYAAGLLSKAKKAAENFIDLYEILPDVADVYGFVLELIGDREGAQQIYKRWYEKYPDDERALAFLAQISFKLGDYSSVDNLINKYVDSDQLGFQLRRLFASLMLERGRIREALDLSYEIRRSNFDKPDAHLLLANMFFEHEDHEGIVHFPEVVVEESAVKLKRLNETGETEWIIIENREKPEPIFSEYHTTHPLAQAVLGKKKGDKFIFQEGFNDVQFEVIEIQSKYVRAYQETLEKFNQYFAGVPGLWKYTFPAEGKPEEVFKPIVQQEKQKHKNYQIALDGYLNKGFPVGTMASLLGVNPLRIIGELRSDPDIGLISGGDDQNWKIDNLTEKILVGVVIDITASSIIYELGIQEIIKAHIPNLYVTQSTLDLLIHELSDTVLVREKEFTQVFLRNGELVRYEVSVDQIKRRKAYLSGLLDWLKANSKISIVNLLAELSVDQRQKFGQRIGESFFHSALVAKENTYLLFSEDLRFRNFAQAEWATDGLWIQKFLYWLFTKGKLTVSDYQEFSAKLAALNLKGILIDIDAIFESAKRAQWKISYEFKATLEVLNGYAAPRARNAASTCADLIKRFWLAKLLPLVYESIIHEIIRSYLKGRIDKIRSMQMLRAAVNDKFRMVPLEIVHISSIIESMIKIA